jgi:wyosine [tRNA(Phe)-imidazoG37] synthetase (radical SAM superfamily)
MCEERRSFYAPEDIARDVRSRLAEAAKATQKVDYLTFVPDGEATLDVNLGKEISLLKGQGVPVGVITNGSLLGRDEVREELEAAAWISLKIDAIGEAIWRRLNRPHQGMRLSQILDGMERFAKTFGGELTTETMLVEGINDNDECIKETADFIRSLQPRRAYLSVPTRPPAERWVRSPDEESLVRAYQLFAARVSGVEYLIGYEGDAFSSTGDIETDLLGITAVHPMREEAVRALLSQAGSAWEVIDRLVAQRRLVKSKYNGHVFYVRRFARGLKTAT